MFTLSGALSKWCPQARLLGCRLGILAALAASPAGVSAQEDEERFLDVGAWRGTMVASVRSNENTLPFRIPEAKFTYDALLELEFYLDDFEDEPAVWRGRVVNSNLEASYRSVLTGAGAKVESWFGTTGPLEFDSGADAELRFSPGRGWTFKMNGSASRTTEVYKNTTLPGTGQVFRERQTSKAFAIKGTPRFPFPARGMVLFGTGTMETTQTTSSSLIGVSPHPTWEVAVYLEPAEMDELKLEIEDSSAYKTWRPETTPDAQAGEPLNVTARVVTKSGGVPKVRVAQFIWELEGTSTEPGVAMNAPADSGAAWDGRYDLELDAEGEAFRLDEKKQRMERAVREGHADTVKVVPYDWGGWSKLQVTAIMADGRRVRGKLKGHPEFGLRLPKREQNSHIADVWKEQNKPGADDLDDEKVAGQDAHGDGFTLWEEYRGWYVNGEHVSGDPSKKDFFVLNLVGPDAENGISLFESLSQLRVHRLTDPKEMSEESRLVNGNRSEGAHVVDQHGVWIKTFSDVASLGDKGAHTVMLESGVAGRPGLVKGIGFLPRGHADSIFNEAYNLPAGSQALAYDRAIAHELLHSVGVEHHGSGEEGMSVGYVSTRNPSNTFGRPYYSRDGSTPLDLRTESGEDVAERDFAKYQQLRATLEAMQGERLLAEGREFLAARQGYASVANMTPEDYVNRQIETLLVFPFMRIEGVVGVRGGESSGDQDCVMRYYFSMFYPSANDPNVFYLVEPGTEPLGLQLCRSPAGTGVNAPGRHPQSRYGEARAGCGNCFSQVCPNDAVPPRKTE